MFAIRPLALFISACVVAGCAVGPDYRKPDIVLADQFIGQTQLANRSAVSNATLAAWWDGFGDSQLSRYVLLALEQNLDMAQASARIAQARSGLGSAQAALLPSGNASMQATKNRQSLETPLGQLLNAVPGYDRNGNLYETNLNAGWELDVFGGLRRGQEAAFAEYQAARAGSIATRLAVAAQTADLYISLRGLQARLEIARKQLETQQQLLSKVTMLYSKGLAPKYQVQQAEGAVAQVKAGIPVLEAGIDASMNALDVVLGVPPGTYRAELAEIRPVPTAPQIASIGSPADLLRRRPDLIVAERRLAAANAKIGAAVAEYYPKLALNVLIGSATAISGGSLFSSGANQAAGVLGLRWRLFDFGRIDAQIALAKGQEAEALAAYRHAALRASEDVESAIYSLVKREEQTSALLQGEDSLAQARNSTLAAYQKGVVSLIEVLHADESLLRTSDAKAQAQTEAARSAVATFKALGGGWDENNTVATEPNNLSLNSH